MLDAPQTQDMPTGAPTAPVAPVPLPGLPGWKPSEPALPPIGALVDSVVKERVRSEARRPPAAPAIVRNRLKGIAILGSHPATVMQAPFADEGWLIYACSPDNTPYGHTKNRRELPRFDQWFELHAPIEDPSRPFGYLHYVSRLSCPVWMRDERAMASGLFKSARPYPEAQLRGTDFIEKRVVEVKPPVYETAEVKPGVRAKVEVRPGLYQKVGVPVPNGDGRFCAYMFTSSIAYIAAKAILDIEGLMAEGRIGGSEPPMLGFWGILQSGDDEYAYQRAGTQYFIDQAMKAGIRTLVAPESRLFDMPSYKW